MKYFILFIVIVIGVMIFPIIKSDKIECIDGDTFKVNDEYYRLTNIDTPEKNERGYSKASDYTCDWLNDHEIEVKSAIKISTDKDIYGRTLINLSNLEQLLIIGCYAEPCYGYSSQYYIDLFNNNCK